VLPALTGYITYHKHFEMISAPEHMGSVYARSTPGSKIRQYVADEAAFVWVSKCYYNNDNDGHWSTARYIEAFGENDDFMEDVLKLTRGQPAGKLKDPRNAPKCTYHHRH
jgi:hypothetical protein